jgi:hypothetical protein
MPKVKKTLIRKTDFKGLYLYLSSGDAAEYAGCTMSICCFSYLIKLRLPQRILPPYSYAYPDAEHLAFDERIYGFSLESWKTLIIRYGRRHRDTLSNKFLYFDNPFNNR